MFKRIIIALCLVGFMGACETSYLDEDVIIPVEVEKWEPTKQWHKDLLKKGFSLYQVEAFEKGYYTFRWEDHKYTKEDYIRDFGDEPSPDLF